MVINAVTMLKENEITAQSEIRDLRRILAFTCIALHVLNRGRERIDVIVRQIFNSENTINVANGDFW